MTASTILVHALIRYYKITYLGEYTFILSKFYTSCQELKWKRNKNKLQGPIQQLIIIIVIIIIITITITITVTITITITIMIMIMIINEN